MDDNSSGDDEVKESPLSTITGGKKLKLNDGSSQESSNGSASSSKMEKDENVDSGVSADKSESTSSEERPLEPQEGPSNVVINAAASSNIHGIVLNIRRPFSRCYRKRKTPDRDSDSDNSLRDSDDSSPAGSPPVLRRLSNSSDAESINMRASPHGFSDVSRSPSMSNSNHSSYSNTSDSGPELNLNSDDSDSDNALWTPTNPENEDTAKSASVLSKTKPKHTYFILREVINRELGLSLPRGKARRDDVLFEQRFYGSLHSVYRLQRLHSLHKHRGCVNAINFHPEGQLLASGSDDTNVVVWDWARQTALQTIKTGHKSNVFQSKFLYLNARSQLNIVTCARDGQVRLLQCPPSGGATVSRRRLASHARAAHKLHVWPGEPHLVVSAGEDGVVMQCDVRAEQASRLFQVRESASSSAIPLYSVSGHPLEPRLLCVAGRDRYVRVYDARAPQRPRDKYCPATFGDPQTDSKWKSKYNMMHLTCAIYNHDGSEILGSYNDEDIYLFDTKRDACGATEAESLGYTHRYSGHRNSATFKGVAFFGPRSQYVVSGSDCSHIYIWEKRSEAIVQWVEGDTGGVVNCVEAHPRSPVLASSGLDKDIKIWLPSSQEDPGYVGLEKIIRENSTTAPSPLFSDFLPTLYNAWRGENRVFSDEERSPPYGGNIEFDGNVCTAF